MAAARRNRPEKRDRVTWDNGISHCKNIGISVRQPQDRVDFGMELLSEQQQRTLRR
jgi:hypothetical protein